jgi:hypothetical protein
MEKRKGFEEFKEFEEFELLGNRRGTDSLPPAIR